MEKMTKLTNEELLAAVLGPDVEFQGDFARTHRVEILKRMAEGAAGEASPQVDLLIQDCAMLLRRVVVKLKKGDEASQKFASLITDFLQRKNLTGSLLRSSSALPPEGCYCEPGKCMAPVIMGRQMPCRDLQKAESGSASTAGPRPRCPKCESGNIDFTGSRNFACCRDCHFYTNEGNFAQFFAAAPAEDAKEKHDERNKQQEETTIGASASTPSTSKTSPGEPSSALPQSATPQRNEGTRETLAPEDVQLDVGLEKRIAEIRERESKTTKGPWTIKHELNVIAPDPRGGYMSPFSNSNLPHEQILANVEFAARARADIPFLLEQLALLRRVSGKGAQRRCWKCEAKIPHEWQFCEPSPAPVPAAPEPEIVKALRSAQAYIRAQQPIWAKAEDLPPIMHEIGGALSHLPAVATTQGTPEGAK